MTTSSTGSTKTSAVRGASRRKRAAGGAGAAAELPDPVTDYALAVMTGEIVANRLVWLACRRHLRDLFDGERRGLVFDRALALRAIEFFRILRHYKGKWGAANNGHGERFELSLWQKFVVGSLFGWIRAASGLRRFSLAYLELARKNGKSTLAAGIALYLFIFDGEPGVEVYSAATKKDQAKIVWGDAETFVKRSPALRKRIKLFRNSMIAPALNGRFEPLSADEETLDGLNPHGVVIDELHRHKTRAVVDVMETAQGAREQPMQVEITTAGDDINGVCWEHHDYSIKVLEEVFEASTTDTWFAYVATLDEGDDWQDEQNWIKANPNLGVSVLVDKLREKVEKAINVPGEQREVKRLRFNIWAEGAGGWMPMDKWNACAAAFDPASLAGREAVAGLDLSSTTDVTAYVELFPPTPADPIWRVLPFFWVPEAKIREARSNKALDRVRYDLWLDEKLIFETPGDVVDYNAVLEFITERRAKIIRIAEIGFDPWNATQLANDLIAKEFVAVEVRQGFKTMSEPTKKLMELVLSQKIAHGGNKVLRWMASNVAIDKDASDNHKPNKQKSRHRIDGIAATITALSRAIARAGVKPTPNVYQDGELLVL